jgi:hypothetical protein
MAGRGYEWKLAANRRQQLMSSFTRRGEGFEKKFALDGEQKFKAGVRRNKLLGLWAAEKLGLTGTEAAEYAKALIKVDFSEPGEEDVFRKVSEDFAAQGVEQSEHQIRRTMEELMATAAEQIQNET